MSDPSATGEQPAEQQVAAPTVSTAPAPGGARGLFSRIPGHLGRARTSTVVLAVLFVGIYALYLNVKPPAVGDASTSTPETSTTEPAPTPAPTTTAPETSAEPTTSAPPPTTSAPTTAPEPTTTEEPTGTSVPEETAQPTLPTTSVPQTRGSTPTLQSPPG
jgi:cytoskeletal protein RodZ